MLQKSLYVFSIKIFLIIQTNKQMISVGYVTLKPSQFIFAIIVIKNSFWYIFDQMQPLKKHLTNLTHPQSSESLDHSELIGMQEVLLH